MDWAPTVAGAAKPRTRKEYWGNPKEIQERRASGCCLRCGEKGHLVRQCKSDLKGSKGQKEAPVRVAATAADAPSARELSSSEEDEGKE
jgi:hypothetical protein